MKRTRETSEPGLENWYLTHPSLIPINQLPPAERSRVTEYFWPASLEYSSPLPSVFLCEKTAPERLQKYDLVLVRDGLLSLLWFFEANPSPKEFNAKLLVHEDFAGVIPRPWRKRCGLYRHVSLSRSKKKPTKLLLLSIVMDTFCPIEVLEKQLVVAKNAMENKSLSEIAAFLPPRLDSYGNERRLDFYSEFYFTVSRHLGNQIKVMTWAEFEEAPSLENFYFYDLNSKFLCSDNYLVQKCLSRKARHLTDSEELWPGESLVRLSMDHGIAVREKIDVPYFLDSSDQETVKRGYEQIAEAMSSSANTRLPWPTWFKDWSYRISREMTVDRGLSITK